MASQPRPHSALRVPYGHCEHRRRETGVVNLAAFAASPSAFYACLSKRSQRMTEPLIVIDPDPRGLTEIFEPGVFARLQALGRLEIHEGAGRMPAERLDALLPEAALLVGQSDMPRERLDRAKNLRAIVNVETNFLQNVDYETCFESGIHVITPSSAFARPVAEMTLGLMIDLARGITAADRAMRAGSEKWLLDGAAGCFSIYGAKVGLIGFGDLARAFVPLLAPFVAKVRAYDPWVSAHFMAQYGIEAAPRDDPARRVEGLVLSPHRAGAMADSLYEIGRQTVADAELIPKGLPPLSCRRAQRETVLRSRSKPIERG
jgi:phosphoglycerate dehydrogenase-like enzyme